MVKHSANTIANAFAAHSAYACTHYGHSYTNTAHINTQWITVHKIMNIYNRLKRIFPSLPHSPKKIKTKIHQGLKKQKKKKKKKEKKKLPRAKSKIC
uniref:Uncharacterized protein n=1 Tax=Anguilla anguilla TaxID=7936 RepID=A0A0E9WGB6_ANGAN